MRYLTIVLFLLQTYPLVSFLGLCALTILLVGLVSVAPARVRRALHPFGFVFPLIFIVYMVNLFAGHFARNALLRQVGEMAEGIVVAERQTNNLHNDEPVWRYEVLLKAQTPAAKPVSTECDSSDFNIDPQPLEDGYLFPTVGEKFKARFLPEFPRAFLILSDDDSEYSKRLRMSRCYQQRSRLEAERRMSPQDAKLQAALAALHCEALH